MKKLLLIILFALCAVCAAFAVAACNPESKDPVFPDMGENVIFRQERDYIAFAKDMEVNSPEIIGRSGITLKDTDSGKEIRITAGHLTDGIVSYEDFELGTAGLAKTVKIKYRSAECVIKYDVKEYAVDFHLDENGGEPWRSFSAEAELSPSLELSVSADISGYNYSVDAEARENDASRAVRFNGWYNDGGELVTGVTEVPDTQSAVRNVLELHAHFLSEEEFADYDISYDNRGRRVFAGYNGEQIETLAVPEGVTYVNFYKIFSSSPQITDIKFKKLHLPSTVRFDVPFSRGVNTTGLTAVTVDKGNPDYSSYNGAVYSKNYDILYLMPASSENVAFHDGLTEFGSYSCAYWHISALVIPDGITALQHYCFAYSDLISVDGVDKVETIMSGVFFGTAMSVDHGIALYTRVSGGENPKYSLSLVLDKTITEYTVLPGTVRIAGGAFSGCENLVSVDLGEEVESIGGSAFSGCTSLKSVTLPASLKSAGSALFYNCTSLERVEGFKDITYSEGRIHVAHAVPDQTFFGCSSLSSLELPDTAEYIGASAFHGCVSLVGLVLPDSVNTIRRQAFYGCGINKIKLPSALTSIGEAAFSHSDIEEVDLNACPLLETLPERCFEYTALTSVTIPSRFSELPAFCFYYTRSLGKVNLGNIEELGERVFGYCNNLTEIVWSANLKVINARAFTNCTAIRQIIIPDSVETVGGYAFQNCTSLEKITLGKGVTSFGSYAFEGDGVNFGGVAPALYTCNNLKEIAVAAGNTEYKSVNGVLYSKSVGGKTFGEGAVLIAVPQNYKNPTLALPAEVRVITPYAVHNQKTLSTVTLNRGLENIGKAAFYNSKSLTELKIPSTVTNIGASILLNCSGITAFSIEEANPKYSTDGNLVYTGDVLVMYMGLSEDVTVRAGTVKIGDAVFMNNAVIESIEIPDSVTAVGVKAFNGCKNLKSIKIGSGLKEIAADAFASLPSLESITVSPDNTAFKAVNNILYSKDGKTLLLCAAKNGLTSLDLAEGVTNIGDWAFAYHATLKEAIVPEGVKTLGAYSFYECRAMEYFYGSQTLERIGERAFSFATSITPSDNTETRFCDVLKTVMLYGNTENIGNFAFYGQYGLESVFFKATAEETHAMIVSGGSNITYLTHGCPKGATGGYYNEVKKYIYLETEPDEFTIPIDGYGWFFINEDGTPEPWSK